MGLSMKIIYGRIQILFHKTWKLLKAWKCDTNKSLRSDQDGGGIGCGAHLLNKSLLSVSIWWTILREFSKTSQSLSSLKKEVNLHVKDHMQIPHLGIQNRLLTRSQFTNLKRTPISHQKLAIPVSGLLTTH